VRERLAADAGEEGDDDDENQPHAFKLNKVTEGVRVAKRVREKLVTKISQTIEDRFLGLELPIFDHMGMILDKNR